MPTPSGVPVAIKSPGNRVMVADSVAISVGISKISSARRPSWTALRTG